MVRDDCGVIGQQLLEYLYRELDEAWRLRVDRHLAGCARCREDFEGLQSTLSLIDDSTLEPEENLSDYFSPVVVSLLQRRIADRSKPWAGSVVAALLVIGVFISASNPPGRTLSDPGHGPSEESDLVRLGKELKDPLIEDIADRTALMARSFGGPKAGH
jgi:predicted anti-sigma-YlaC factor YlaD